jgi:exosortase O
MRNARDALRTGLPIWLRTRGREAGLAAALACAWLLLFRDTLVGLCVGAPRNAMLVDLALAAGLLGLLVRHIVREPLRPTLRATPLAIVIGSAGAHLLDATVTQIDLASGIFMVIGAWGLLGLYVSPRRWMQAIPLLLAGLCVLPVGPALDLYVGFPLRHATAKVVFAVLAPVLPAELVTETIIVVDGGTAGMQVDLPCSGVRSLWSGAVFWAAATWIERARIGWAWWLASVGFVAVLVATNLARVVALVSLYAFAPPFACTVLHMPLGVVAFVVACVVGWVLLRFVPRVQPCAQAGVSSPPQRRAIGALVVALLVAAAIPTPRIDRRPPTTPTLASTWASPVVLSDAETRLFSSRGAVAVGKWDLRHGSARGQLLLVHSRSWRAQHRPDVCHAASGRRVDDDRTVMIDADFPVRLLRLTNETGTAWGIYWFQSLTTITDDHDARVWSSFGRGAEDWVMVSLVLDGDLEITDPDVTAMLHRIRAEADALMRASKES